MPDRGILVRDSTSGQQMEWKWCIKQLEYCLSAHPPTLIHSQAFFSPFSAAAHHFLQHTPPTIASACRHTFHHLNAISSPPQIQSTPDILSPAPPPGRGVRMKTLKVPGGAPVPSTAPTAAFPVLICSSATRSPPNAERAAARFLAILLVHASTYASSSQQHCKGDSETELSCLELEVQACHGQAICVILCLHAEEAKAKVQGQNWSAKY
eukprot:scaffold178787_cov18-Tisochrysis_lutea.AAC.1